jgi:hypothetical protein
MRLYSNGRLLALPPNTRLGWELKVVANTHTYYDMAIIMIVKRFLVQAPGRDFFQLLVIPRQGMQNQGRFTEGEGSVELTSSFRLLVL